MAGLFLERSRLDAEKACCVVHAAFSSGALNDRKRAFGFRFRRLDVALGDGDIRSLLRQGYGGQGHRDVPYLQNSEACLIFFAA